MYVMGDDTKIEQVAAIIIDRRPKAYRERYNYRYEVKQNEKIIERQRETSWAKMRFHEGYWKATETSWAQMRFHEGYSW